MSSLYWLGYEKGPLGREERIEMSTHTDRVVHAIRQNKEKASEVYDLGYADCRKREVEPLREVNALLLEALKMMRGRWTFAVLEKADAAIAEAEKEQQ